MQQNKEKIIRQRFKSSIMRGTGESHLIMMEHPDMDFSTDIINTATQNYSYDYLSEGGREDYLFELIELSKQKEKIKNAILHRLLMERQDDWILDQLFQLAALFAKQGDIEAKKAVYKRFYKKTIQGSELVGEDAILEMDGLNGLIYIAETKGKIIKKDPEEWEDSFMVDFFQEENPTLNVYDELQKSANENEYVRIYLNTISNHKFKSADWKRPVYNYDVVRDRIDKDTWVVPLPPAYAKDLSNTDIQSLADDFLNVRLRKRQEMYMRVFDMVKYPYNYKDILNLSKRPYSKKDRLVEYAVNSLRYFTGSDIRDFALSKLSKSTIPEIYTNLLIANYQDGDGVILKGIVEKTKSQHKIHNLAFSYVDIYQANKTADCQAPLIALYDKLTSGLHRADIVKILIENNVLPDKIWQEIKYDSSLETRELTN